MTREHARPGRTQVSDPEGRTVIAGYDAVLVSTDHDAVDYAMIAEHAKLVIDTRNVFARKGLGGANVVKA